MAERTKRDSSSAVSLHHLFTDSWEMLGYRKQWNMGPQADELISFFVKTPDVILHTQKVATILFCCFLIALICSFKRGAPKHCSASESLVATVLWRALGEISWKHTASSGVCWFLWGCTLRIRLGSEIYQYCRDLGSRFRVIYLCWHVSNEHDLNCFFHFQVKQHKTWRMFKKTKVWQNPHQVLPCRIDHCRDNLWNHGDPQKQKIRQFTKISALMRYFVAGHMQCWQLNVKHYCDWKSWF